MNQANNADETPGDANALAVRPAPVEQILDLRHRVLRAGLPPESARFEGDDEPATRHFAAVDAKGRVVGCATVLSRPWQGAPAWQVRGMAVEADCRAAGVGRALLEAVERHVREADSSASPQLWCNARTPAVPFYRRLGWEAAGEEFVIEHAGPHFKMTKRI